jgi:uncharacterized protein (TIGR03084 family)
VTTGVGLRPGLLADLADEGSALDRLVADLAPAQWATPSPAPGWTVAHQIAHLAWSDQQALLAVRSPDEFGSAVRKAAAQVTDAVDAGAQAGAQLPPAQLLAGWRRGRADLLREVEGLPEGERIPWYGPPMSASSLLTARLMETWAHGLDVADALGVRPAPTGRVRHVAHLGIRTRDFSFAVHGLAPPREEFRVELTGPDGEPWAWGPDDSGARLVGDGVEFALLVTQRINLHDTSLRAEGPERADVLRWLEIAQAFAGPPGQGRPPARS